MSPTRPSSPELRTPLCDLLGIRHPMIQAPMAGGWTTPELVAEVGRAGAFGVLAGARLTPEKLREDIQAVRKLTDKPFGVNFLLAPPEAGNQDVASVQGFLDRFRERLDLQLGTTELSSPSPQISEAIDVVFEERVPVFSTAMGDPGELVERAHAAGMLMVCMVTTVEEAVLVAERGADLVVAQGAEAGGHRSTFSLTPEEEAPLVGTMALVPRVVDAVGVPVVAAGGIADGRGLLAALALGASGVQMGTRFLLARESGAHSAYRRRLLSATETETVLTRVFTGRPARALRNRYAQEYLEEGPIPLAWPLQGAAAGDIYSASQAANDGDYSPLWAGQSVGMLTQEQRAAEIVEEILAEAADVLSGLLSTS